MKKIITILSIGVLLFATSCDEKEWPEPAIKLTPVYTLSKIQWGEEVPAGIAFDNNNITYSYDVYQEKPLMIAFKTEEKQVVKAIELSDYIDNSTDSIFDFSFTAYFETTTEEEEDSIIIKDFTINGSVITGIGMLLIEELPEIIPAETLVVAGEEVIIPADTVINTFSYDSIQIIEDDLYN